MLCPFFEITDIGIAICVQLESQPTKMSIMIVTLKYVAIVKYGE